MNLIEEIKETLNMEIRPSSHGVEYLEAVIHKDDFLVLESLLKKYLGSSIHDAEKEHDLPEEIQNLLDSLGGLWEGQSFFYKQKGHEVTFASLWPWESDPDKITLKCGKRKI